MLRNEKDGILKYWKRIFQLYISWSVINFISVSLLNHSLCIENVQTYIYQIFFNGYGVLWYLWGILIALPLLIKLRNGGAKPWCFLVIAVFAYLLTEHILTMVRWRILIRFGCGQHICIKANILE